MPIILNQGGPGKVAIRATSNEAYIVAGNNSVSNLVTATEVSNATSNVTVNGAHITRIAWSSQQPNGHIQIARSNGSANVILWDCYNTGVLDLKAMGLAANSEYAVGNLTIFFAGTVASNGFVLIELQKEVTKFGSNY